MQDVQSTRWLVERAGEPDFISIWKPDTIFEGKEVARGIEYETDLCIRA